MISNKSINISTDFAMRVFSFLMTVIVSCITGICAQTSNPQWHLIRYEEKIRTNAATFENGQVLPKAHRVSSKRGNINLIYQTSVPDSIDTALTFAKSLWESKIYNNRPINIKIIFDYIEPDVAMFTDVLYYIDSDNIKDLNGCPSALAAQITDIEDSREDFPDGSIFFNADIDWTCNFSGSNYGEYNLTTMALIGIGRCLGFGSSVTCLENKYYFTSAFPSYFDKLLYNNSTRLSDLAEESLQLADFVTSDNVYLHTPLNTYKVYAPEVYAPHSSLCYLDEDNSLMSYSVGKGSNFFSIDDKTTDIIKAIGWNLPQTGLNIKSYDVGDNGIGSSYESHSFYIDKGNKTIENCQWLFSLKNKSGQWVEVSTGNTQEFTIGMIDNPEDYYINLNGDLEGKIECDYSHGDAEYSANPFYLSLELEPVIFSIEDLKVIKQPEEYSFYVTFSVCYAGADYITVDVERENDVNVTNYYINEPFIAHVVTDKMWTLTYNWIHIRVKNKYGEATKVLTFNPEIVTDSEEISCSSIPVKWLQFFNLNGTVLYEGNPAEFRKGNLAPGIYIRKEMYDNNESTTFKYIVL